jgi:hypothetical protein
MWFSEQKFANSLNSRFMRGTPCERSWEATGKLGYNYPQSSANTLE